MLESIRILDGQADLLAYHQQRLDRTRRAFWPKCPAIDLARVVAEASPPARGLFKLRVEYGERVRKTELIPYQVLPVTSLRLLPADEIRYGSKFADRTAIRRCLERKGSCDDVLMSQRGYLTDTSYANVALFDGRHWYTPAWPLLRGTRRESLLEKGIIRASIIRDRDLPQFQKIRLINAMLPWEEGPTLDINAVMV
ncbi:aminotransferase class IV [Neolewinella lacunae]|uniref:Aminotransferase class IV n=1 Tax=Neolewinella lacunae TaxID=1517758 RepID=A0A923T965_9BACT|nr:aminotransferase class IV [Neolewinella lacunae]MBC6995229.1 aminotransferase class IV [Neolewinella lacunae]MDN3635462.1 aminotransferase class IV [Neolewinella lacunae]